jgi:hypothetical protein
VSSFRSRYGCHHRPWHVARSTVRFGCQLVINSRKNNGEPIPRANLWQMNC